VSFAPRIRPDIVEDNGFLQVGGDDASLVPIRISSGLPAVIREHHSVVTARVAVVDDQRST
jgi:hypothetical protein